MSADRSEQLAELLRGASVPIREGARERAVAAAGAQASTRHAGGWDAPRIGFILALLAALTVAALTPPGRAVAEWAAELVGIGEVGGPPTADEHISSAPPSNDPIVFATGTAPNGKPFEIVAYKSTDLEHDEDKKAWICVAAEFPEGHGSITDGGSMCYTGSPTESNLRVDGISFPNGEGADTSTGTLTGEANAETRRVEVSYLHEASGARYQGSATVAVLDGKLGERIGVVNPTAYFYAFLPDLVPDGPDTRWEAEAVGYDAQGEEVGRSSIGGGRSPAEVAAAEANERAREQCEDALRELRGDREGQIVLSPEDVPAPCREVFDTDR